MRPLVIEEMAFDYAYYGTTACFIEDTPDVFSIRRVSPADLFQKRRRTYVRF